jgi:hypothetical protein
MIVDRSFFLVRPTGDVTKDVFTVDVVAHFDGQPKKEYMYEYSGEQVLSMAETRKACDNFGGTVVNPFVANPTGVYLVSMWKAPPTKDNPSLGDFRLLTGSDATLVTDLSEQDRINLMQILAAEREDEELTNIVSQLGLPSCDVDCGANGAICATVDLPFTNGCVCPTLSAWSTEGNTLSCDDSLAFTTIVPGARYLDRYDTRDTWQRGTRAAVSWSLAGTPRPVQLHLVPVNAEDTVVAEPLVFSLSAEQVAEGSFEIELPFDFAPTASHAHVAFATRDAAEVGPTSWGRYTSVGYSFVLAGTGCIADDVHGECVPQGTCGGVTDQGRIDGGAASCAFVASSYGPATCCVPRSTPTSLPAAGPTGPMFLLPETGLVMYVGQQVTLRVVLPDNDASWAVRRVVEGDSFDAEETTEWTISSTSITRSYFLLATSSNPPLLADLTTNGDDVYNIWETSFTVDSTFALNTDTLASEIATFEIVMAGEVVAQLDATVRFPPCAPSKDYEGFNVYGEADFTAVNTVGQCASKETCRAIEARETDAKSILFIDVEDLCGDSLGEDVVCCRAAGFVNDGFRAEAEDSPSGSLSTGAIIAIAAGSLCFLALCTALCCATVLIAKRHRSTVTAAPVAPRAHGPPRSRRVSRRASSAHV